MTLELDDTKHARGCRYDAVAQHYPPIRARLRVVLVDYLADDVRAAHAHIIAQHDAEAETGYGAADERRDDLQTRVSVREILREVGVAIKACEARIARNYAESIESAMSMIAGAARSMGVEVVD